MKAIVPAAGQGTRLYPQTHTKPKPMVRVAGKPILGHILDGLVESRIREAIIVVGVMRQHVVEFVDEYYDDSLDVDFAVQETTEGLGHCIYQARDLVGGDDVCITLGDMLFGSDYDTFLDAHDRFGDVDGSIGVKRVEEPSNYGIVEVENGRVTELVEKPDDPRSNLAISGVYVIENTPAMFDAIEHHLSREIRGADGEYQLTDALQRMVERGADVRTFDVDDWYDCGRPETLLEANQVLLEEREGGTADHIGNSIVIPPVDVGEDVTIRRSVVGPYVSVDDDADIADSRIRDGIVGSRSRLRDVNLSETIVGEDSTVIGSPTHLNVGDSSEVNL